MIKFAFFTCLAILLMLSGCHQNSVEVLGVSSTEPESVEVQPQQPEQEYVFNGGPGSTEVVYEDEYGKTRTGVSNVVKVPIYKNCDKDKDLPTFKELDILDIPEMAAIPGNRNYVVCADIYSSQNVTTRKMGPEIDYKTDVFIPRIPAKIELTKSTDQNQLCCDDQLTYRIKFKNVGGADARNIRIDDVVPAKVMYLEETAGFNIYDGEVELERDGDNIVRKISWSIPGPIAPDAEGEVFYSVTCPYPVPRLYCNVTFEPLSLGILEHGKVICKVTNGGNGKAHNVFATVRFPVGLEYKGRSDGTKAIVSLGDIEAGYSIEKEFDVTMRGPARLSDVRMSINADNAVGCNCDVPSLTALSIVKTAPVEVTNRLPIEYTIVITNTSDSLPATGCILLDKLPDHSEFKSASDNGLYQAASNMVEWSLGTLEPGEKVERTIVILPKVAGAYLNEATVSCAEGIKVTDSASTFVRGISALHLDQYDTEDPVEVGGLTTYVTEVINEGFQNVTDLKLIDDIPDGTEFVEGVGSDHEGNTLKCQGRGKEVVFEPIPVLPPAEKAIFKVTVRVKKEGSLKNTARVTYHEFSKPLIVEEPTHSYEP